MDDKMAAVGNSATASKSAAGLDGDEVFNGRVSINQSENGGFILSVGYDKKRKGSRSNECIPCYSPDKQLTFASWAEASAAIDGLYKA